VVLFHDSRKQREIDLAFADRIGGIANRGLGGRQKTKPQVVLTLWSGPRFTGQPAVGFRH